VLAALAAVALALMLTQAVGVEAGELRFNITSAPSAEQLSMPTPLADAKRIVEYGGPLKASASLELPPGVYEVVVSTPSGSSRPLTIEVGEGITVVNLTVKPVAPKAFSTARLPVHPAAMVALILAGSAGLAAALVFTVKSRV